jgi:hypothetical protein
MEKSIQNRFLHFAMLRIATVEMTVEGFAPAYVRTPIGMTTRVIEVAGRCSLCSSGRIFGTSVQSREFS